jgi:diguanylate cyclase (GGDEF)-like protein
VVDGVGAVTHYIGSFFDITASKTAEAKLVQLAYFDPLTQLPNRRLLLDRLTQALAVSKRSGLYGAILFVDLDHFKVINDTRGHEAGDLVLIEAARRLRGAVRAGDSVARLGGDEFVVLLEGLDAQSLESAAQAQIVAEKILVALSQPYKFSDYEFHCTASIGLDMFTGEVSAIDLIQHSDLAMYQSKIAGRNRLRFFDPAVQTKVIALVALGNDLRHALDPSQFILYFQPQVNSQGHIVAAEALLRWQHSERGLVSPSEFISLAEETELIIPIGIWVLQTACAQLKTWKDMPVARHLRLAVNVSACQYRQDNFTEVVQQTLNASAIDPSKLVLEVTESMMLDVPDAISKMNSLKAMGVRFSMDDFGTGYSSLASLTQLPLSELKIDQSFVGRLVERTSDAIIVRATIAMGHALGLEVIAEGVETQEQRDMLMRMKCQLFQGYLFSRPLPIGEFEALLK